MSAKENTQGSNVTSILIAFFYSVTVLVHVLVIAKIIPYNSVNGGMSKSYEAQIAQSLISLVVIGLLFLFILGISKMERNPKLWQCRALYVITGLWVISLAMQLLGTSFERYVMSLVVLIGVVGHVSLIRNLRQSARKIQPHLLSSVI